MTMPPGRMDSPANNPYVRKQQHTGPGVKGKVQIREVKQEVLEEIAKYIVDLEIFIGKGKKSISPQLKAEIEKLAKDAQTYMFLHPRSPMKSDLEKLCKGAKDLTSGKIPAGTLDWYECAHSTVSLAGQILENHDQKIED